MNLHASHPTVDELARVAPFDAVRRRALRPLVPNVDHVHIPAGVVVARNHDVAREFVIVTAGVLTAVDASGTTRTLGPGSSVGGDELTSGKEHHETVVADTDADVLVVNGPAYRWAAAELFPRSGGAPRSAS